MCLVVSSSPTDLLPGRLSVILSALPTAKLSVAEEQVLSTRIYVYRPFAGSLGPVTEAGHRYIATARVDFDEVPLALC